MVQSIQVGVASSCIINHPKHLFIPMQGNSDNEDGGGRQEGSGKVGGNEKQGSSARLGTGRPQQIEGGIQKANTDGRATWRGDVTIDRQSESQNGYPVDIKDFEADQEQDGATI